MSSIIERRIRTLIAALCAMSCAPATVKLYEGPTLGADQVVLLERGTATRVLAVDGVEVKGWHWELTPGTHEVALAVMGTAIGFGATITDWHACKLRFSGTAGSRYVTGGRTEETRRSGYLQITKMIAELRDVRTGELFTCIAFKGADPGTR